MTNVPILLLCKGKRCDNPMNPDWVPSVFSDKKAVPLPKFHAAGKKIHHRRASKKKQDIARLLMMILDVYASTHTTSDSAPRQSSCGSRGP